MKVSIGCDHGGYDLKESVKSYLEEKGIMVVDMGCKDKNSCDYPQFGKAVCDAVVDGSCDYGIVICTTGIGMSIVANKVKGIRCALCADSYTAKMTKEHNNSNVLAMGAGIVGINLACEIVDVFLGTKFSEEEKHQRRIDAIE